MQFQPLMRYVGGKRKQSEEIIGMMPMEIGTCYIPFLGSGAVMFQLINSNIKYNKIVVSDIYAPLMGVFDLVKDNPDKLLDGYKNCYKRILNEGEVAYNNIKFEFNNKQEKDQDPVLFYCLTRSAIRGSLIYDNDGNFITNCQKLKVSDRNCISSPDSIRPIIMRWHDVIQDVDFRCEDYWSTIKDAQAGDFVFLDPPYIDGTWYRHHNIDYKEMWDRMRMLPCDWSMTLNGDKDRYPIPNDLYTDVEYIYYGIKTTNGGRPVGSRDTYWMKKTDQYIYDETRKRNIRNNERGSGGKIPQVNDILMMNELGRRVDAVEGKISDVDSKLDQILNLISNMKGE